MPSPKLSNGIPICPWRRFNDREVVKNADQLLDFGPAAGRYGGQIVAQGTPDQVARRRGSVTGPYLSGKKAIPVPINRRMESMRVQGSGFGIQGKKLAARRRRAPLAVCLPVWQKALVDKPPVAPNVLVDKATVASNTMAVGSKSSARGITI